MIQLTKSEVLLFCLYIHIKFYVYKYFIYVSVYDNTIFLRNVAHET